MNLDKPYRKLKKREREAKKHMKKMLSACKEIEKLNLYPEIIRLGELHIECIDRETVENWTYGLKLEVE